MNEYRVQVEVRGEVPNGGYRLKVSVLELGMYIDGFRAYPSSKYSGTWYVTPPSTNIGGNRYKSVVEFDKSKQFWASIADACSKAVDEYRDMTGTLADVGF